MLPLHVFGYFFILLLVSPSVLADGGAVQPIQLRVEYQQEPLGVDVP